MSEHWPQTFRLAVEAVFDGRVNNTTYESVAVRVRHAFKVWRNRYAMTPEQEEYAWSLLAWAVRRGGGSACEAIKKGNVKKPYVYLRRAVAVQMEKVVNDPMGHEGFKRRAGLVDVTEQLREAVAA